MALWTRLTAGGLLRVFLVVLLVPVLAVLTPTNAQAAAVGDYKAYSVTLGTIGKVTCKGSAAWNVPDLDTASINVQGVCDLGSGVLSGSDWEAGSFVEIELRGYEANNGGTCSGWQDDLVESDDERATYDADVNISTRTCIVNEICVGAKKVNNNLPDDNWNAKCTGISLGSPEIELPDAPEGCTEGSGVRVVEIGTWEWVDAGFGQDDYWRIRVKFHVLSTVGEDRVWRVGLLLQGWDWMLKNHGQNSVAGPGEDNTFDVEVGVPGPESSPPPPIVGLQIAAGWTADGYYNGVGSWNSGGAWTMTIPSAYPPYDAGYAGITDPSRCRYYWGEKVANIDGSDVDEPVGDLPSSSEPTPIDPDDIPDPPEAGCDVDITSPTTWLCGLAGLLESLIQIVKDLLTGIWNAVKAVASVLGDILAAIADLVGDLIGALGDLMEFLFVPSQAHLQEKIDGVRSAWENAAPVVWVASGIDVVEAMIVPAPTGCQGPDLTVTDPVSNGSHTLHPLAACDGAVAVIANVVNNALKVLLLGGSVMVGTRIVGRAMGIETTGTATAKGAE